MDFLGPNIVGRQTETIAYNGFLFEDLVYCLDGRQLGAWENIYIRRFIYFYNKLSTLMCFIFHYLIICTWMYIYFRLYVSKVYQLGLLLATNLLMCIFTYLNGKKKKIITNKSYAINMVFNTLLNPAKSTKTKGEI